MPDYDLNCPYCGDSVGSIYFPDDKTDDELVVIQELHPCGICGPLVAGRDRTLPWTRDTLTLESARDGVTLRLNAWLSAQYATPIVVNDISLAADPENQSRLADLYAAESGGVQYGGVQLTDSTGLVDSFGVWQSMTVQDLFTLLLSYSATCKLLVQNYATIAAEIAAATSVDDLAAIAW